MQKEKDILCPTNCPYLAVRSFLPNTLPFYCNQFATFLGMTAARRVEKCALCMGIQQDFLKSGLALLDAQPSRIADLKRAFLQMKPSDQRFMVDILSKEGFQLHFTPQKRITSVSLFTEILRLHQENQKRQLSSETQSFIKLLNVVGDDTDPPMDGMTRTLLTNLFQVVDASEKGMLLSILENPARLKNFLNQFSNLPQDQNLLKNFRSLLYEADKERENTNERNNLIQRTQLNHMMEMMSRVRMQRQRDRMKD